MSSPSSETIPAPAARAPARPWLPRWIKVAAITLGVALAIDLGILLALSARRPGPPPLSPLFASAEVVRELQQVATEQPRDPEWPARLGKVFHHERHYLSAIDALNTSLRLGGSERAVRETLAVAYSRIGRHDEALRELKRLSELAPDNAFLQLRMADEHSNLDQPEKARALLDAIPRDPAGYVSVSNPDQRFSAMQQLAAAYGELGNWNRALTLAKQLAADAPTRPEGHALAATALAQLGRAGEAVSHLESGLRASPEDAEMGFQLADTLVRQGRTDQADRIRGLLEMVIRSGRASGVAYYELGRIYEHDKKWRKAGDCFDRASQKETMVLQSLLATSACYLKAGLKEPGVYAKGLYFERLGRFRDAEQAYRELTKDHECCQTGFRHIARVQRMTGYPRKALATLQKAAGLPGKRPSYYVELAKTYQALHDIAGEERTWKEITRLYPAEADVGYQNLGEIAYTAGKLDEAEAHYRKCVELQPQADLYRLRLGERLLQRREDPNRLREAIEHLEKAVSLARNNGRACLQLGTAYRMAGRNHEAVWALRHAIDLEPGDGTAYQPLGEALTAIGKPEEGQETLALFKRYRKFYQAWETLRARVRRSPKNADAHREFARFCEHIGAADQAAQEYLQVLALRPGDRVALNRLGVLNRQLRQATEGLEPAHPAHGSPAQAGAERLP